MLDKILPELIDSISELRGQKNLLSEKLTNLSTKLETQNKTTDAYTLNVKEIQDKYARDYEAIQKQLLEVTSIIDSRAKEYVNQLDIRDELRQGVSDFLKSIPIPKNGKDATIDYKKVNDVIVSEVSKIKPDEVDYDIVFKKIESLISEIPKPKDGKDAVVDYTEVNKNIKEQLSNQKLVKDVIYTSRDNRFEIQYTNGDKKKISPKEAPIYLSGGAGGGIDYNGLSVIEEPLLNDDELMIFRDGKPFKVKMSVLGGYFGNELPINTITDINGQGYTDLENNYYTSL